ncbi:MAG: COX15/CtaA family protein [Natronomonas sp.]
MNLRRLLLGTTVFTAFTALVGVVTAASGAGLTCEARWPLCDGAVFGLFPANFMSFIEWSHRLVAGITGLLIVGVTALSWYRGESRRIRLATLLALLLTPLQIVLGAFTVLVHELVFGYSILVLTLHFGIASLILASLVAATVWAYAEATTVRLSRVEAAGAIALLGFPLLVATTPRLFVTFGEFVQFSHYAIGFGTFAALCVVALWVRETTAEHTGFVTAAAGTAAALVVAQLIVARQAFGDTGQLLILGLSFAAFLLTMSAVWRIRRIDDRPSIRPQSNADD